MLFSRNTSPSLESHDILGREQHRHNTSTHHFKPHAIPRAKQPHRKKAKNPWEQERTTPLRLPFFAAHFQILFGPQ